MSRPTALIISVVTNYVGVNFCSIFGIYGLNTKVENFAILFNFTLRFEISDSTPDNTWTNIQKCFVLKCSYKRNE